MYKKKGCAYFESNCYEYCVKISGLELMSYVCDEFDTCYCVNKRFRREIVQVCEARSDNCFFRAPLGNEMRCQDSECKMDECRFLCFSRLSTFDVVCEKQGDCSCHLGHDDAPKKFPLVGTRNHVLLLQKRCNEYVCGLICQRRMGDKLLTSLCVNGSICACVDRSFVEKEIKRFDYENGRGYILLNMGMNINCAPKPSQVELCRYVCERFGGERTIKNLFRQNYCLIPMTGLKNTGKFRRALFNPFNPFVVSVVGFE